MYLDIIFSTLAIILIYFFVIKEKNPKSLLIAGKKLWLALHTYQGITICILVCILALWGLNIDITNGAKKTCIIVMVISSMYIIYRFIAYILEIFDYELNLLGALVFTIVGTIFFWWAMVVVFHPEFESCLG